MEGGGGSAKPTVRIQWSQNLENSLEELAAEASPGVRGYWRRLEELWRSYHPTLPSRGQALAQRLCQINKGRETMLPDPEPEPDADPDPDPDPEPDQEENGESPAPEGEWQGE